VTIARGGALPTNAGTAARIALLDGITDFATFPGTARSGGACESNPHDPIHDDIGLHTSPFHDMAHLGYAAHDPIFFAHHCNIDKIWASAAGHRMIPLNSDAMTAQARLLGSSEPEHYVFQACEERTIDPSRPRRAGPRHGANLFVEQPGASVQKQCKRR
jgi:hypothetical protein